MSNSANFFKLIDEFQKNIDWLNQVLKGGIDTSIVIDGVTKPAISKDIHDKWAAISALIQGSRIVKETLAELQAVTGSSDTLAEVWNDIDPANNGLYGWNGSAWVFSKYHIAHFLDRDNTTSPVDAATVYRELLRKATLVNTGNLYNPDDITPNCYIDDNRQGELLPSVDRFVTGYIPVEPNTKYTFFSCSFASYFNKALQHIEGGWRNVGTVESVTPNDAAYIRFSPGNNEIDNFLVWKGSPRPDVYIPYDPQIDVEQLKDIYSKLSAVYDEFNPKFPPILQEIEDLKDEVAIKAPWELGTNLIANPLFDADPLGTQNKVTGYHTFAGGHQVVQAHFEVASVSSALSDVSLKTTHFFSEEARTDLQLGQIIKIDRKNNPNPKARLVYKVKRKSSNVLTHCHMALKDTEGRDLPYPKLTKVSTDGADNTWYEVIYEAVIDNPDAATIDPRVRLSGDGTKLHFPPEDAYVSGVYFQWDNEEIYDRNIKDEIDRGASEKIESEKPAIMQEVYDKVFSDVVDTLPDFDPRIQLTEADRYSDLNGNLLPIIPKEEIVAWGDSMTAANWIASVVDLYTQAGDTRTGTNCGIGGDNSRNILDRIEGYQLEPVGTPSVGTVRLLMKREIPWRLTQESYRQNWVQFGLTISEPYKIEIFNKNGKIATTYNQFTAECTFNGKTVNSPNHPFKNDDAIHFREENLPSGMYRYKQYYVQSVTGDTFELAEIQGQPTVSFGSGMAVAHGDFYYDWDYQSGDNTDLYIKTFTERDNCTTVLWTGNNDTEAADLTFKKIKASVDHLKSLSKRVVVMSNVTNSDNIKGTQVHSIKIELNKMLSREYPDNYLDIWALLKTQYDPNNPQDVQDIANDIHPSSLRVDGIHLNSKGNLYVAEQVHKFLSSKSW